MYRNKSGYAVLLYAMLRNAMLRYYTAVIPVILTNNIRYDILCECYYATLIHTPRAYIYFNT